MLLREPDALEQVVTEGEAVLQGDALDEGQDVVLADTDCEPVVLAVAQVDGDKVALPHVVGVLE